MFGMSGSRPCTAISQEQDKINEFAAQELKRPSRMIQRPYFHGGNGLQQQPIDVLLVEDNARDLELAVRGLYRYRLSNRVHVVAPTHAIRIMGR